MTTPLAEIDDLQIAFAGHDGALSPAVRRVSLTVERGERLGIVGESGSGKSLTGGALLGLLPPEAQWSANALRFNGQDLLAMRPQDRRTLCGTQMSMILQDPKYSLNPVMTVAQQMRETLAAVDIRDPERVADVCTNSPAAWASA